MQISRHIPNTITSMNLLSGAVGVVFTLEGRMDIAFPLMLAAAVFDFCDGLAARALHAYSPIGKELDSLADLVSFGLLPALMLCKTMAGDAPLTTAGWPAFLPLVIAVFSALRLARFNTDERQTLDFIGLPTPACAMVCGSLALYVFRTPGSALASWVESPYFVPGFTALAILLVSEIPMFGMKIKKGHRLLDAKRIVFFAFAALAIFLTVILRAHWSLAPLLIFSFYILENLACAPFKR
jgi:CDP-diacylglycerol--serine O-phosphatidyltransferase